MNAASPPRQRCFPIAFLYGQQLVKDLRTGYEVGNPATVFDGDLDGFIAAGIRWRKRADADD